MSVSLIDRVRERLAAESAPLRPNVVAAAIRAESGGVLGDTEVLSNLRMLQTELTGVGILEPLLRAEGTTDVLGHRAGRGMGRRWKRVAAQLDPVCRRGCGAAAGAAARAERGAPARRGAALGGRPADRRDRRPVHRPAARGARTDRLRRHLPVAAGAAAGDTGSRDADTGRRDRRGGSRTAGPDHRRPAGVPCLRRHRRRQDHASVGRPRCGLAATNASSAWRTPPSWSRDIRTW